MDYKQRGYRLAGEEGLFIWNQKTLPISALAVGRLRISHRDDPVTEKRLRTKSAFELEEVELMVAGMAAPKVGYFVEAEAEVADDEPFKVDQAWIQFSDILPNSLLNLRVGKMLNEFYHLSQKRRLIFQRYLAPITFNVTGVELNGTWRRLRFAGGIVNDERSSSSSTPPNTPAVNLQNRLQGLFNRWRLFSIWPTRETGTWVAWPIIPAPAGFET